MDGWMDQYGNYIYATFQHVGISYSTIARDVAIYKPDTQGGRAYKAATSREGAISDLQPIVLFFTSEC